MDGAHDDGPRATGSRSGGSPFGPGGPFSLGDHDRNRALLSEAGFEHVEVDELRGAMPFESPAAYWDLQSQVGGPMPALIAGLAAAEAAEIREAVESMVEQHATSDGYRVPSSLVIVSARWSTRARSVRDRGDRPGAATHRQRSGDPADRGACRTMVSEVSRGVPTAWKPSDS